jgi:hypothetical protein
MKRHVGVAIRLEIKRRNRRAAETIDTVAMKENRVAVTFALK